MAKDSIWKTKEELAEVSFNSMGHQDAGNMHALKIDSLYRSSLASIELVSQVWDSHDRETIDLDHYYGFFPSLSRAMQKERGMKPEMFISDTTDEVVHTEDVKDVIRRGARTWTAKTSLGELHARVRFPPGIAGGGSSGEHAWFSGHNARDGEPDLACH